MGHSHSTPLHWTAFLCQMPTRVRLGRGCLILGGRCAEMEGGIVVLPDRHQQLNGNLLAGWSGACLLPVTNSALFVRAEKWNPPEGRF